MSTTIMSPITTTFSVPPPVSELSRSEATYYVRSSSPLPRPTISFWSLERSRTTFRVAAAAKHPRSSSSALINDDPDRDEEDHIRGIKRKNRNTISTTKASKTTTSIVLTPRTTSPSKRRCYPSMMLPFGPGGDSGMDRAQGNPRTHILADHGETAILPRESSTTMTDQKLSRSSSASSSLESPRNCPNHPTTTHAESECGLPDRGGPAPRWCNEKNECDDNTGKQRSTSPPLPKPPEFRRHATIRDRFDLACSIDEFTHDMISS